MSKETPPLEALLRKYIAGSCTPEEAALVRQWMDTLELSGDKPTEADLTLLKKQIDARIQPVESPQPRGKRAGDWPIWSSRSSWPSWAAAAILVCVGTISLYRNISTSSEQSAALAALPEPTVFSPAIRNLAVYRNDQKDDRTIMLADGSRILLKSQSCIHLDETFPNHRRNIYLKGKARFDVAEDPNRPFSVITGDIHTTALGTVFWVTHNRANSLPSVSLMSGKVAITRQDESGSTIALSVLKPGDLWDKGVLQTYVAKPEKTSSSITPVDENTPAAHLLTFHHTSLKKVFAELAQQYDTRFDLPESGIEDMKFYGSYAVGTALSDILQHIALTQDLQIQLDEATGTYQVKIKHELPGYDRIKDTIPNNY